MKNGDVFMEDVVVLVTGETLVAVTAGKSEHSRFFWPEA